MIDSRTSYRIAEYGRKAPFSSFLPGVAGEHGIPLWCFYVNRGQAIAGFGSLDKHHSIMEFCPANTAYQRVPLIGFRTFIKKDGQLIEPFADGLGEMTIEENAFSISWTAPDGSLSMNVRYFIVPNMSMCSLARRAVIINQSTESLRLEVLDGLSAIVPFGLNQHDLKMMGQTAKAWMMVEGLAEKSPYFRLRASLVDTTSVEAIEDGSFGAAQCGTERLPVIVDPTVVFGWDTSFVCPVCFEKASLKELLNNRQRIENELPCCFFGKEKELLPGEKLTIDSLWGLSHGEAALHSHLEKLFPILDSKEEEANKLLGPYLKAIETSTADPLFDQYCRQSYLDNFLRGGVPTVYHSGDRSRLFYLYSRKHGDLERDYNEFVVTPEYASQGNGNYRDVLQNRRSDTRFCPEAGWEPLKPFFELIQADGYNPLVIQPTTFRLPAEARSKWSAFRFLEKFLESEFTPGSLLKALESAGLSEQKQQEMLHAILCDATPQVNAAFAEGYWVDHWIYLLDMLESILSIYPECKTALLEDRCLRWYESRACVQPLAKRCVMSSNGLRQYNALEHKTKANTDHGWLLDSAGNQVQSTMLEKMMMLCALKFAALDESGEAVSMEAGKPGWYDALNGLPALFGSSTAESCELWRTLHFLCTFLKAADHPLCLPAEMAAFLRSIAGIAENKNPSERWLAATALLEEYREKTCFSVSAEYETITGSDTLAIAEALLNCISASVNVLLLTSRGVLPTYFTNLPTQWENTADGIVPTAFDHRALPPFLEGTVHALRLPISMAEKLKLISNVRRSDLWDEKLRMYKVSADLSGETPELGRANAFTRGWLEHESIWLHMEYKYLLEMLKNGFYDAFFEAFSDVLIPFQPAERYGRSVLENSSFLASSANPDPGTHGRGFVARLSGATAEFLEMWQIMFFGTTPFTMHEGVLQLKLVPSLPAKLIPSGGEVSAMFLGNTRVVYHLPAGSSVTPASHRAAGYRLLHADGSEKYCTSLLGQDALDVRSGCCSAIHVTIEKC